MMIDFSAPYIFGALVVSLWLSIGVIVSLIRKKITIGMPFKPVVFERSARPKEYWIIMTVYVGGALSPLFFAFVMWLRES
jgi:hypothetical protein